MESITNPGITQVHCAATSDRSTRSVNDLNVMMRCRCSTIFLATHQLSPLVLARSFAAVAIGVAIVMIIHNGTKLAERNL